MKREKSANVLRWIFSYNETLSGGREDSARMQEIREEVVSLKTTEGRKEKRGWEGGMGVGVGVFVPGTGVARSKRSKQSRIKNELVTRYRSSRSRGGNCTVVHLSRKMSTKLQSAFETRGWRLDEKQTLTPTVAGKLFLRGSSTGISSYLAARNCESIDLNETPFNVNANERFDAWERGRVRLRNL